MTTSYILSSMPNFIRIPYSIYEIFNSFKLLSQISVTDMTYFLADVICDFFTFQQGSAPAHRARETLALYCQLKHPTSVHHPHWIGHQTLNSPDLNPVDYAIWDILHTKAAFVCRPTSAKIPGFMEILSKFSAVTVTVAPRQTFTVYSPRGALQVWKIL